jgi:hypothetical protein
MAKRDDKNQYMCTSKDLPQTRPGRWGPSTARRCPVPLVPHKLADSKGDSEADTQARGGVLVT